MHNAGVILLGCIKKLLFGFVIVENLIVLQINWFLNRSWLYGILPFRAALYIQLDLFGGHSLIVKAFLWGLYGCVFFKFTKLVPLNLLYGHEFLAIFDVFLVLGVLCLKWSFRNLKAVLTRNEFPVERRLLDDRRPTFIAVSFRPISLYVNLIHKLIPGAGLLAPFGFRALAILEIRTPALATIYRRVLSQIRNHLINGLSH